MFFVFRINLSLSACSLNEDRSLGSEVENKVAGEGPDRRHNLMPNGENPCSKDSKDDGFLIGFLDSLSLSQLAPNTQFSFQSQLIYTRISFKSSQFYSEFMASAVRRSTEQADLDSLIHITQHLSDLLDIPESQPRLLWPPKLASTALPKLASLATQFTMPKLSNVNGSKLHTYSVKAAPYPLSYNQAVLDSWVVLSSQPSVV